MTARERFTAVVRGEPVDRLPYLFGGPRASTFAAWRRQGLTPELEGRWGEFLGEEGFAGIGKIDFGPWPRFEERVLETRGNLRVWTDHYGVTRIDAVRQPTPGFATRRYLEFPVRSIDDFRRLTERYDPDSPERTRPLPGENARPSLNPDGYRIYQSTADWRKIVEPLRASENPVSVTAPGLWWTARDWAGFEGLCMMCAEHPAWVEEMMEFWTGFLLRLLDAPLRAIRVDLVILNEDMAYKHASMISPAMMRRFMRPGYGRLYRFFQERGVTAVMIDSDGHCREVLDAFRGAPDGPAIDGNGPVIDGIAPIEIAANNDPGDCRRRDPGLFVMGGIDKRELARSKRETREETARRFRQAREFGRYIPTVDHGVPPDVPLRNYLHMVELARGFAAGADLDSFEPSGDLECQLGPMEEEFDPIRAIEEAWEAF